MTARPDRQDQRRGALPVSWTLLVHRARLLASYLDRAGVRPGDRVAIDMPAGPALTALTYACWQSGMTVVVSDPDLTSRERLDAFTLAEPTALVSTSSGLRSSRSISTVRVRVAAEPLTVLARAVLHTGWDGQTAESPLVSGPGRAGAAGDPGGADDGAVPTEAAVVVGTDDHGQPRATSYSRAELVGLASV